MSVHERMMRLALVEAQKAFQEGEIPVGAVVAQGETVVSIAHNQRQTTGDPTAHAEVLAIRQAAAQLGRRRLNDCTLYVTLEPCPMCAGAMILACVGRCYYGAADPRQGCVESVYALPNDPAFFHHVPCTGGLLADESARLLQEFFQKKRPSSPKELEEC